ncbi:hypothetical protein RRG08_016473 [Elysia crispata]|uniref:Uncharacterized protein n=1 Tax=Elysia crispata TaxID=231223 RepID=A0AAE0Y977_9GAST|nr:hypothetical protein RRG08_016473 [Elysia crispata]
MASHKATSCTPQRVFFDAPRSQYRKLILTSALIRQAVGGESLFLEFVLRCLPPARVILLHFPCGQTARLLSKALFDTRASHGESLLERNLAKLI